MPLFWRVFATNAAILVIATLVLAVSPATISSPLALTEALVLVIGLSVMLVLNLLLLRRSFVPLERLTAVMQAVDPLRPGERIPVYGPDPEVAALTSAFNDMLDRLETERRESARRALAAQEAERLRIARELHDEIGQTLTAVVLELERAARLPPGQVQGDVTHAREAARASLDDLRRIARQLRPEALDDLGLVSALNALATAFSKRTGVKVERRLVRPGALSSEAELVIYRVAQESLTNVARHAHARTVELELSQREDMALLRLRDDGRGIEPSALSSSSGIRGMRERAVLVGATLSIGPAADRGTEVRLEVPVEGTS
jgi:two-component system sensor histidine kinase UhpB